MPTPPHGLLTEPERALFAPIADLALGNPFDDTRIPRERIVLADAFVDRGRFVSPGPDPTVTHPNIERMLGMVGKMLPPVCARYAAGAQASDAERRLYLVICFYWLYDVYHRKFQALIDTGATAAPFFKDFLVDHGRLLGFLGEAPDVPRAVRLFEILFQCRRAFHFIYTNVRGKSAPIARLRAAIWAAIFGGPLDDYGLHQWSRMSRISTLILGPSGTGKELVAKAIGSAGYVPFNVKTGNFAPYADYYAAINLLAFSPGLLESELFGHKKGAFTGASRNKRGLLETARPFGALLLDEVADIEPRMQVMLLRVLQERTFRRVGDEGRELPLHARILTATHRDPAAWMAAGLLREDFFRRICMLKIVTPSLRERFDDCPDELRELVGFLAADFFGPAGAARLTDEVEAYVIEHLPHHPWTGNMRELLQCVVEVKTFHAYHPERPDPALALAIELRAGKTPLAEISRRAAELALTGAGSQGEAAGLLGIDVRTLQTLLGIEPPPRGRPIKPSKKGN